MLDVSLLMKVSVEQFYGIECEDFLRNSRARSQRSACG